MTKTVVAELQDVLGLEAKPGETQEGFSERLARKSNDLTNDEWEALSEPAQVWVNNAIEALDKKRSVALPSGIEEVLSAEGVTKAPAKAKKPVVSKGKKAAPMEEAKKKGAKVKAPAKAKAKPAGRGPNGKFGKADKIKVVPEKNPFREGSKCFGWFGSIKDGMTIEEAVTAGAPRHHIRWAHSLGHIKVG